MRIRCHQLPIENAITSERGESLDNAGKSPVQHLWREKTAISRPRFIGATLSSWRGAGGKLAAYLPLLSTCAESGRDFFCVLSLSNSEAGVFICDVVGHGLRAVLVTAIVRGLIEELAPIAPDPGRFLTQIN